VLVLEHSHHQWLAKSQQPLWKKGNGHEIHISNYMLETRRQLVLNADKIAAQAVLPPDSHLHVTDARKIIYLDKNADKWWDLPQFMEQLRDTVNIFEYIHPEAVGIWTFDCSSAHEGLVSDALNVNKMNVNPGGKQTLMQTPTCHKSQAKQTPMVSSSHLSILMTTPIPILQERPKGCEPSSKSEFPFMTSLLRKWEVKRKLSANARVVENHR
jgi:hypothetical protein